MTLAQKKLVEDYTYRDYLKWQDNERWELLDGVPYMMSAPSWQHQFIVRELLGQLFEFFKGKKCQVFASPFDLRIPIENESDEDCKTVVQPDLLVVCEPERLSKTGYFGIPALVVEIISGSSGKMDKLLKFNRYEKAGVKEYWLIDPIDRMLTAFKVDDNGRYGRPDLYGEKESVVSGAFPDLTIELEPIFAFEPIIKLDVMDEETI